MNVISNKDFYLIYKEMYLKTPIIIPELNIRIYYNIETYLTNNIYAIRNYLISNPYGYKEFSIRSISGTRDYRIISYVEGLIKSIKLIDYMSEMLFDGGQINIGNSLGKLINPIKICDKIIYNGKIISYGRYIGNIFIENIKYSHIFKDWNSSIKFTKCLSIKEIKEKFMDDILNNKKYLDISIHLYK